MPGSLTLVAGHLASVDAINLAGVALAALSRADTLLVVDLALGLHWERAGRILIASGPVALVGVVIVMVVVVCGRRCQQR